MRFEPSFVLRAMAAAVASMLALAGSASADETIIDSFDSILAWTESPGATCSSGENGTVSLGFQGYVGNDALLSYDLTSGNNPNWYTGCSVLITRDVSSLAISPAAIAFWVLSPPDAMVNLDLTDASGQTLTYHVPRPLDALDSTQWYQQVVELDAPSAWSLGGSGVLVGPIQTISLEVQNRASYLTSGTIAFDELGYFDAIGGDLDPFGSVSPAPAGSANLTATFAVNVYQSATVVESAADAGFPFVRADMRWYENELDAGYFDFSIQDKIQKQLDLYGMKAMWVLGGGNPLYGDCAPNPDGGTPTNGCAPMTQKSINQFQAWATVVAEHFQGTGDRYEIWNEPADKAAFKWKDYTGLAYAPVLNAGISGIHSGDPDAGVTCGGLASPGNGTPVWPGTFAWSFLTTYLDAGGGVGANAVAFHPYRGEGAETVTDDLVLARSLLGPYFSALPEVWETEWGYDTGNYGDAGVPEALAWQALYDLRLLLASRAVGFGLANVFSADFPGYSIVTKDGGLEPAAIAVATLVQQTAGRTFAGFIPATPTSLEALRFDGSADALVVLWSAMPGGNVDVTLPAPATSALDMMGNQLALATDGGVVAVAIAEANGPIYVTLPWPAPEDGGTADGGPDAGVADAGVQDAGAIDAGPLDGGPPDAGHSDAGPIDGGVADAGPGDAGRPDAGMLDGGVEDAGIEDSGVVDGGAADAGKLDAGLEDAGAKDAGGRDGGGEDAGHTDAGADGGTPDGGALGDAGPTDAGLGVRSADGGAAPVSAPSGCGCSTRDGGSSGGLQILILLALVGLRRPRWPINFRRAATAGDPEPVGPLGS